MESKKCNNQHTIYYHLCKSEDGTQLLFQFLCSLCFQLAGVVAVEITGGPTIDFVPGRRVFCGIPSEFDFL